MLEYAALNPKGFSVYGSKVVTARILNSLGLIAFLEFSSGRQNFAVITKKGRLWARLLGLIFLT